MCISATFISMHPLRKQPLLELLILLAGMISIMLLIQGTSTWIALSTTKQTPAIAKKEASDLRPVQAASCPYGSPDFLGSTQLPKFTASTAPVDGINKIASIFAGSTLVSGAKMDFPNPGDSAAQPRLNTIVGKSDGLKFYKAVGAQDYTGPSYGHIVEIPTTVGQEVKVPFAGRRILNDTNLFGLVFSIESDGVRIANSRNDSPTGAEGYNLYITGIIVNPKLIERYNKGNNQFDRSCMPEMNIGDILGTARSTSIKVALRDNGRLLPLNSQLFWNNEGAVVMDIVKKDGKDTTVPAQNQPPAAAPVAPAVPAAPAAPAGPGGPGGPVAPATTTPGPAVPLDKIQKSINLSDAAIAKVKTLASQGGTQNRSKILLMGDSNTANPNFGTNQITWNFINDKNLSLEKLAKGEWGIYDLSTNPTKTYVEFKYALILIGTKDTDTDFNKSTFETNLRNLINKLTPFNVIPILQTIAEFRNEGKEYDARTTRADLINKSIKQVATDLQIPYVDTTTYIKSTHMTKDGFHYNTKRFGPDYCNGDVEKGNCDPPYLDTVADDLNSPITGHGIRNVILREVINLIESKLSSGNRTIVIVSNRSGGVLKPLTLFGVQAQTASESIISILQSYGSSGYLCYDFGGLSCVPATLSTIEGRAVRVDVTVDKSYPAKPICVSRTNSCNGGIFLDPNL